MTKGYLCIAAAMGIALSATTGLAESPAEEGQSTTLEAARAAIAQGSREALAEATERAEASRTEMIEGWRVVTPAKEQRPLVRATRDGWTIVADAVEDGRLISPRVLGPELTLWGPSGVLEPGGIRIDDASVVTNNRTVRAKLARVSLTPFSVELIEVVASNHRAE